MVAYSAVSDLLTGDIPTPDYLSPQKFVDDAADEIDSKIGHIYVTPVDLANPGLERPASLLLKRLNNFLATGRLLMAVAASGEDDNLHAYAWSLVKDATEALDCLAKGEVPLNGAPKIPGGVVPATAPLQHNEDAESNVDAFYNRIMNPYYSFGLPYVGRVPYRSDFE